MSRPTGNLRSYRTKQFDLLALSNITLQHPCFAVLMVNNAIFLNFMIITQTIVKRMSFNYHNSIENVQIVTIDSPLNHVLRTKTEDIKKNELALAQEIIGKLFSAIKPHLPAAGLAAPQIGISKSVFIYSFDRDPNHLEGVINPSYTPVGEAKIEGWEGCFSAMLSEGSSKLAKIPRFETIHVQYLNERGERVEKVLEGFAAKVFQHECDHLLGTVNIDREDAVVKDFPNQEEMLKFMQEVKKKDSLHYKNPN